MRKTLNGPGGIRIELDSREIFPADPGQGTPAMVYLDGGDGESGDATYWCALNEGEVDGGRHGYVQLSDRQMNWLASQEEAVGTFLEENEPND